MPDCQSNAYRSAGVAGRRLNPNIVEQSFAYDAAVCDAVQRDAASHAEPLHVRFLVNMLYSHPKLSGKRNSFSKVISLPRPIPIELVAHSPTPSIVRIAASSKGEG